QTIKPTLTKITRNPFSTFFIPLPFGKGPGVGPLKKQTIKPPVTKTIQNPFRKLIIPLPFGKGPGDGPIPLPFEKGLGDGPGEGLGVGPISNLL
ncbi:MAG: hypothetical protein ABIN36_08320, partial [Ferruginibacter sp.]